MKTSGARAKGRGQPAGPPSSHSARAVSAYASASPLDFQEPWRDEPEPSSQNRRSVNLQQKQMQTVGPAVSEDELPEDWEEAASAVESSDEGLKEAPPAPAPAVAAPEAAALAVDDASVASVEPVAEAAFRGHSDSIVTHGTHDALSVHTLADGNQAEAAAAAPPASDHTDEARVEAEAASAAARDEGAAEAVSPVDGSHEAASAAGHADETQKNLAVAAQGSETSAGVADAALPSASEEVLLSMLVVSEPQSASQAAAAPHAEPESLPHHVAVLDMCVAPGKEDAHAPAANECHGCHAFPQVATSLLVSREEHQPGICPSNGASVAEAEQDGLTSIKLSSSSDAENCEAERKGSSKP